MICRGYASRAFSISPPRGHTGMPPLLAVEDPGVDQPHLLDRSIHCVTNVPRMTMPWLGRASLRPQESGDVFYKTAADQAHIRSPDDLHGEVSTGKSGDVAERGNAGNKSGSGGGAAYCGVSRAGVFGSRHCPVPQRGGAVMPPWERRMGPSQSRPCPGMPATPSAASIVTHAAPSEWPVT
jgi:hypothetical protein